MKNSTFVISQGKVVVAEYDDYSYPLHSSGYCSTLPTEYQRDLIKELHDVCREVAGLDIIEKEKPKIGFY